jgi:hypothetical protein
MTMTMRFRGINGDDDRGACMSPPGLGVALSLHHVVIVLVALRR